MGEVVHIILSNKYYTLIAVGVLAVIIFLILKKLLKLLIYAVIILIAFLAYVYYTGKSIDSVTKPVEKIIDKAEKIIK